MAIRLPLKDRADRFAKRESIDDTYLGRTCDACGLEERRRGDGAPWLPVNEREIDGKIVVDWLCHGCGVSR